MQVFERILGDGYEQVVFCQDKDTNLKAIISIHDSTLGPGTGGCRMYPYETEDQALEDVLRLSKGMTFKAAISGLKLGGAKAVIIGNPKTDKTPALLKRFGKFVDGLGGRYITAKDVGINGEDLKTVKTQTRHILGIEGEAGGSGDPSPLTAWGVYNGMQACAAFAFGSKSLKGRKIAIQGLGYVSQTLVDYLAKDGAHLIAADVDSGAIEKVKRKHPGIEITSTDRILEEPCDIFSPNALGAIINSNSIPKLKCKVVAGAANNQLATDEDGFELMRRGITYAPDYAINAGGLINIYHELHGYDKSRAYDHVGGIYKTIEEILIRAREASEPPHRIADRIAEERVAAGKRRG